jgi:hypothetical protein
MLLKLTKSRHKRFAGCVFAVLISLICHGGCGMVAVVGTPTSHEKKVPAEYDLAGHKHRRILVFVEQPFWAGAEVDLRLYLTEAISKHLAGKVRIPSRNLVAYRQLFDFRSKQTDFSLLPPAKIGAALGADVVLLVMVEDFQLQEVADTGYHKGFLAAQTALIDTATGKKMWPQFVDSKTIKVGFEIGQRSQKFAVVRLVEACAHCIARYLYDCPKDKFKIFDDKSDIGWGD